MGRAVARLDGHAMLHSGEEGGRSLAIEVGWQLAFGHAPFQTRLERRLIFGAATAQILADQPLRRILMQGSERDKATSRPVGL